MVLTQTVISKKNVTLTSETKKTLAARLFSLKWSLEAPIHVKMPTFKIFSIRTYSIAVKGDDYIIHTSPYASVCIQMNPPRIRMRPYAKSQTPNCVRPRKASPNLTQYTKYTDDRANTSFLLVVVQVSVSVRIENHIE